MFAQPIQHTLAFMGNTPGNNTAVVHVLAKAGILAGGAMDSDRSDEDRLEEVANGRHVGNMTINLDFTVAAATTGYYEYALIKYEKQLTVPALGVNQVPSSTEINTQGLQQAVRQHAPGWVIKYGTIPLSGGSNKSAIILAKWAKFNKSKVRDGDFWILIVFNRSDANGSYDVQVRYKAYTVS